MTTNVYDSKTGVMATDSRWSHIFGSRIVYVDDLAYSKIEIFKTSAFMFAGAGEMIQSWKDWISSAPTDASQMPGYDGVCVCVVDIPTKNVRFKQPQDITKDGGYFAGSGSMPAYRCWAVNGDARRAVTSASLSDPYSGGMVRHIDLNTMAGNLEIGPVVRQRIDDVRKAVLERGMVMTIAHPAAPFPLSKLAANDVEAAEVREAIASGQISPAAPCDGMYTEWTDEQKCEFKDVLSDIFGWQN